MVGVARNSVYTYAARFLAQGVDGLRDRPRRSASRGEGTTMPTLCPHDRLPAHCMWCLADVLDAESATLAALDPLVARAKEETAAMTRCAYCEAAPAIVRCGELSDAWEGEPLCGACWGLVLADPDAPRIIADAHEEETER